MNARASAWVLYIFQLPAITGLRMWLCSFDAFLLGPNCGRAKAPPLRGRLPALDLSLALLRLVAFAGEEF